MKKNLTRGLIAVALIASFGGAYASKVSNAPKANDVVYSWQHYDRSGNPIGTSQSKTLAQAQADFGCNGTAMLCAIGTNPEVTDVTLNYN